MWTEKKGNKSIKIPLEKQGDFFDWKKAKFLYKKIVIYHIIYYMKFFVWIDEILAKIMILLIKIYQKTLSPDKWIFSPIFRGKICSHEPHCSEYSAQVFKRYGFISWFPKMIERVFNCKWSNEKIYDPVYYKVVFFSWAPIWVPFLKELQKDKRFDVVGVVTMPDAPSGRGMEIKPNIIKKTATELWISGVQTPNSIRLDSAKYGLEAKNFFDWLKSKDVDFLVVIAYGKIMPKEILDLAHFGAINVHGSILPKYRGASPLQSAFLDWQKESGITIMKMDENMDTGNMIDVLKFPLKFDWTVEDLIDSVMTKWPKFLNDTLVHYAKWLLGEVKQDDLKATYCKKFEKQDGEIDPFGDDLDLIYKKYRWFFMWPKIYFVLNWKRVLIESMKLYEKTFAENRGKVLIEGKFLNPCVVDIVFKPEWKKGMDWISFKAWYLK